MKEKINKTSSLWIPLLIFGVMVIGWGSFTFDLGFYLDDWPNIFFQQIKGDEATHLFHAYDGRPLQGWYQVILFKIFGTTAWVWQLYNFVLRFLTVLVSWLILKKLWPNSIVRIGLASILFAIYPVFAQQPIAITFVVHWTSLLFLMLSILLMLISIEHPNYYFLVTGIALILSGLGLILIEYFIGLELIRPYVLWLVYKNKELTRDRAWKKAVLHSLPFFGIVLAFSIWRAFLVDLPVPDRNQLVLLDNFLSKPFMTVMNFFRMVGQDMITMFVTSWYKTFSPDLLQIKGILSLITLGTILSLLFIIGSLFSLLSERIKDKLSGQHDPWVEQIIFGAAIFGLGAISGWLVERQVSDSSGFWSDRFGMGGMAGVAIVLTTLLEKVIRYRKLWIFFVAGLIGLSSAWQLTNSNDYRWSWEHQQRMLNQMRWRIPAAKPNTLFLSTYEFFPKMGVYPTAFAINSIYPQSYISNRVDYWFQVTPKFFKNWDEFLGGTGFKGEHWQAYFEGNTNEAILMSYQQNESHCLWVLNPEDQLNPFLDIYTKLALSNSDLTRILRDYPEGYPRGDILPEASHDWCYYFQKADLAQQFKEWSKINGLWVGAQPYLKNLNSGVELVPFIDGFIHLEEYDQAFELTERAAYYGYEMRPYLCNVWEKGIKEIGPKMSSLQLKADLTAEFGCDW